MLTFWLLFLRTIMHRLRISEKVFVSLFRYVGENYSNAQEAMEDAMHSFYSQRSAHPPLSDPVVGQLVAVRGEDGKEMARAQVMEVMAQNKVKVTCLGLVSFFGGRHLVATE